MIARIWHGRTRAVEADEYERYLNATGIPMYRATPGNRGIHVLRSTREGVTDWLLLTFWDSEEDVRAFAGADLLRARYFPEDERFLLELEPTVRHYEASHHEVLP